MALDAAAVGALYDALVTHAMSLGIFDSVGDHEPANPPGTGLTAAVLLGPIAPARSASGLISTSARLEFSIRIYSPRMQTPRSSVDRALLVATATVLAALSGDFELTNVPDDLVRLVDLLGAYGDPLEANPGWITEGGSPYRIQEITVPLILNDVFPQVA